MVKCAKRRLLIGCFNVHTITAHNVLSDFLYGSREKSSSPVAGKTIKAPMGCQRLMTTGDMLCYSHLT